LKLPCCAITIYLLFKTFCYQIKRQVPPGGSTTATFSQVCLILFLNSNHSEGNSKKPKQTVNLYFF